MSTRFFEKTVSAIPQLPLMEKNTAQNEESLGSQNSSGKKETKKTIN